MIPFASQRAGGQDLATHLMNAHDNQHLELAEVRGAIARDLHGAFAEWEAQARALTRCRQYLCSLSINPDELQGRLTRAQYLDYIDRAEASLGLAGQPRAVIFHLKEDARGRTREHCHVVWSRVDATAGKAVQLSFFKEKLTTVTREFARDHGLDLPNGYRRLEEKLLRRNRQLTGYDGIKQKESGITHEERMAAVTGAWQRSDSGRAFVNALEDLGYVLARGRNETRLVLVDIYGHTTALTRLIDDPAVKAKHVREFLGPDYAPENLPTAAQAQEIAAQHRNAIDAFEAARLEGERFAALAAQQAERRAKLAAQAKLLQDRQRDEHVQLAAAQTSARQQLKAGYLAQARRIRIERYRRRPYGLAAFLGRVTGIALITRKVQRYRDRRRFKAHLASKQHLAAEQHQVREALAQRHGLQTADMQRKLRALDQIEERERKSLEQARTTERRKRINERHEHMPAFRLELKPQGRKAPPPKGKSRNASPLARELAEAARDRQKSIELSAEFARAAREDGGEEQSDGGVSDAPRPAAEPKIKRRRRKIALSWEFNKAAADPDNPGGDGGGLSPKPRKPEPDHDGPGTARPRRPRKRGPGPGR